MVRFVGKLFSLNIGFVLEISGHLFKLTLTEGLFKSDGLPIKMMC